MTILVFFNDVSDHFGIFYVLKTDLERQSNNEYILRRYVGQSNVEKFKELQTGI